MKESLPARAGPQCPSEWGTQAVAQRTPSCSLLGIIHPARRRVFAGRSPKPPLASSACRPQQPVIPVPPGTQGRRRPVERREGYQGIRIPIMQTNQFSKLVIDLRPIVVDQFSGWFIEYRSDTICVSNREVTANIVFKDSAQR